jgi:hypothetical protein
MIHVSAGKRLVANTVLKQLPDGCHRVQETLVNPNSSLLLTAP